LLRIARSLPDNPKRTSASTMRFYTRRLKMISAQYFANFITKSSSSDESEAAEAHHDNDGI